MLVLSSPSGAGKTTLAKRLLEIEDNLEISISVTTRPQRPGEVDGQDYFFYTPDQFHKLKNSGGFLEWAKVFDNFYGTPHEFVTKALKAGRDILFDIDWQGCAQLYKTIPDDIVSIFILPPSASALQKRLINRGQDTQETVKRRMAGAQNEIKHFDDYQYVIINENIDVSLSQIRSILHAERLKRSRCHGLPPFVSTLLSELS